MKATSLMTGLCFAAFAASATPSGTSRDTSQAWHTATEHMAYRHLLHHVFVINRQAEKAEQKAQSAAGEEKLKQLSAAGDLWTVYKRRAALSDQQAEILEQVAVECEREVSAQDAKAMVVINEFRARYPGGRVPEGETLAEPPPELKELQAERNQIILRARDRLRLALGEQEFKRIDTFVKSRKLEVMQPARPATAQNQGGTP